MGAKRPDSSTECPGWSTEIDLRLWPFRGWICG